MADQPQQAEPSNSVTNVSGRVNANAERIDIGGDVVGRDKVTSVSGHIIHAEAGATVIIGEQLPLPSAEAPALGEPPFKGLQYFDVDDAALFYGREHLTARLVARLRQEHFLAVVGSSGSGKSSVIRAGLIHSLKQQQPLVDGTLPPEGSTRWQIHVLTPTAHPIEALAASLTRGAESVLATTTLIDDLRRDSRSLRLVVRRMLSNSSAHQLLLIIDQFEELFTQCKDDSEREQFIDNVLVAANEDDGPTLVMIGLRADFYDHCAKFESLREVLATHQEFIGPMSLEELRRAIKEPAIQNGWNFEPGLVETILQDVGTEPGALPLLSHALLKTWENRRGYTMTLEGYTQAGGVRSAIAKTAESTFNRLKPSEQVIARSIFLCLTDLGEGTLVTRRRASINELTARPEDRPTVELVLKSLADARLVTTEKDAAEVAHEALIREWPTLRRWLDEDREGLRIHRHLTEISKEWQVHQRDVADLIRGARLTQAREWAAAHTSQLSPLETAFLEASQTVLKREKLIATMRWFALAGALGLVLLTVILAATGRLTDLIYPPMDMNNYWVAVPAGEFIMGTSDQELVIAQEECSNCDLTIEQPQHVVYLDTYQIGRYEITNRQYIQCMNAGKCSRPFNAATFDFANAYNPVANVDWNNADDFCRWIGGRLPTEAEWEKAARGDDARLYPWGNTSPDCNVVNFNNCSNESKPVGSYPSGASPYGVMDMAGNVWEWVADFYTPDYYITSPKRNPQGPQELPNVVNLRVVRGGSWYDSAFTMRAALRSYGDPPRGWHYIGFRCARSP